MHRKNAKRKNGIGFPPSIVPPDKQALDKAVADDKAWFAAHPNRGTRLRPEYPGELPRKRTPPEGAIETAHILVEQIKPGVRLRTPVLLLPGSDFRDFDNDEYLMMHIYRQGEAFKAGKRRLS